MGADTGLEAAGAVLVVGRRRVQWAPAQIERVEPIQASFENVLGVGGEAAQACALDQLARGALVGTQNVIETEGEGVGAVREGQSRGVGRRVARRARPSERARGA